MKRYNVMEEQFTEIQVLGRPALFHDMRLDRDSVPKGLHLYEVRYDDEGKGQPVQIGKGILANHLESILTNKPFPLLPDGYLDIDSDKDWSYAGGDCRTVKEFHKKYPPERSRKTEQER